MASCKSCGALLEVGKRQASRVRSGGGLCRYCRARPRIEAREVDFRFWANRFGVEIPKGRTARETLREGRLPDELAEIVRALRERG